MTARRLSALLLLLLALATPLHARDREDAPGLHVRRIKGAEQVTAVIDGSLVSYTFARDGDGAQTIYALVKPAVVEQDDDAERGDESSRHSKGRQLPPCPEEPAAPERPGPVLSLYRVDLAGGKLDRLRDDLPHDASAIEAFDLDGDGADELVLARPDRLLLLPSEAGEPLTLLFEQEGFGWSTLHPRAVRRPTTAGIPFTSTTALGTLTLYGPESPGAAWTEQVTVELPLESKIDENGVRVWSRTPRSIGRASDGTTFFATSPDDSARSRVQTTLVRALPAGESEVIECWGRLPEAEEVLGSSFLMLDDRPILLVTTKPADKLNLFDEKRLRLFALERDRSRLGLLPLFAAETRMNLWQDGTPLLFDANGDGRDDLVLGYWKGILKDRVVLDAYVRDEEGRFERSARTTAYDVPKGDRSFVRYGQDLTGDGVADMLVRGKPGLLVFPGRRSKTGKNLVNEKPRTLKVFGREKRSAEDEWLYTEYRGSRPRVVDFDGDGVAEVFVVDRGSRRTPARMHLLRLDR